MQRIRNVIVTAALAAAAACGGGGGGSGMPSPMPSLKSAAAPGQPYTIPSSQLTATYNGVTYTAVYSETPNNGTVMFDNQLAHSSTVTISVSANGAQLATQTSTVYYLENPYNPLGLTETTNGTSYEFLYTSTNPLPTTLTVGDSGPLGSGNYYVPGSQVPVGSLTETYSVTARDATTVMLSVMASGTLNGTAVSDTVNYSVEAMGNITLVSVVVTVPGLGTLTFS
ncbi:MAG TPA: hypothetical protein VED45_07260 [Steroidobacteraceae bacterium]|nr:hypothetical protein [Steroidobacteraceae bacterium]